MIITLMWKGENLIMGKVKNEKIEKNEVVEKKFTKLELLSAKIFKNRKDILSVLVKDDEKLSISEAQEKIEKFMKGKVK